MRFRDRSPILLDSETSLQDSFQTRPSGGWLRKRRLCKNRVESWASFAIIDQLYFGFSVGNSICRGVCVNVPRSSEVFYAQAQAESRNPPTCSNLTYPCPLESTNLSTILKQFHRLTGEIMDTCHGHLKK